MIENITTCQNTINLALSYVNSVKQFLDADRPLNEVLHLIDNGLANIHDAKTELLKVREMVREKSQEKIPHES